MGDLGVKVQHFPLTLLVVLTTLTLPCERDFPEKNIFPNLGANAPSTPPRTSIEALLPLVTLEEENRKKVSFLDIVVYFVLGAV